jgi:hypothetical protein
MKKLLWSKVQRRTIESVSKELLEIAKPLGEVTLSDLVASGPETSNGLYFFVDEGTFQYIGKAGSRSFIERIPAHLDVRPEAWFGTLLQKLAAENGSPDDRVAQVPRALRLRVAMLAIDVDGVDLVSAETAFRRALAPALNPKRRSENDRSLKLADVC